jgi:hypothetical protein
MDSGLGAIYKKKYCQSDNELCARWKVLQALGAQHVPDTLYPSMMDIAQQIIALERSNSSETGLPQK